MRTDKEAKALEQEDEELLKNRESLVAQCPNEAGALKSLLERINAAKERFAGPRQEFQKACDLRDSEHELIKRIRVLQPTS